MSRDKKESSAMSNMLLAGAAAGFAYFTYRQGYQEGYTDGYTDAMDGKEMKKFNLNIFESTLNFMDPGAKNISRKDMETWCDNMTDAFAKNGMQIKKDALNQIEMFSSVLFKYLSENKTTIAQMAILFTPRQYTEVAIQLFEMAKQAQLIAA